jgi:outer membrane protein TolC
MRKLLILLLLLGAAGFVQAVEVLDFEDCLELAVENDSSLRQAAIDLGIAASATENSWSLLLPSLSLQAGANYSDTLFSRAVSSGDPMSYSLGASLSLQLNRGIAARVKSLAISAEAAELSYEAALKDLTDRVTRQFYSLLLARSELELLEEDLELSEKQLEKSETRFRNGLINERTLLQTRLAMETSRLALSRSTSAWELEKRNFLNILGLDGDEEVSFEGRIDPEILEFDTEELLLNCLGGRTDVKSAALTLRQREAGLTTASAARLPSISLSGGLNASTPDFSSSSYRDSFSAGLSVSIPLDGWIPNSQDDQAVREAEGEIKKAELTLQSTRDSAEMEIRNLAVGLEHAARGIEISELQVDIAKRSYGLAEEGFLRGTVERLELEESRRDLLEARLDLLNGKYEYLQAVIDLKAALNIDDLSLLKKQGE